LNNRPGTEGPLRPSRSANGSPRDTNREEGNGIVARSGTVGTQESLPPLTHKVPCRPCRLVQPPPIRKSVIDHANQEAFCCTFARTVGVAGKRRINQLATQRLRRKKAGRGSKPDRTSLATLVCGTEGCAALESIHRLYRLQMSSNAGATRPIDLGTRFARYAPHLGGDDRNRIADRFVEIGRQRNFTVDISNQRFDRIGWAGFLNRTGDIDGAIESCRRLLFALRVSRP
jgi:hypothetical protein